mmetsp:Transcript_47894/g.71328  ORF Transcript_47894/g.71328 Transcript_47894/m.71328 type:complete len:212 (-) Transcript_47894:485-1120(-)
MTLVPPIESPGGGRAGDTVAAVDAGGSAVVETDGSVEGGAVVAAVGKLLLAVVSSTLGTVSFSVPNEPKLKSKSFVWSPSSCSQCAILSGTFVFGLDTTGGSGGGGGAVVVAGSNESDVVVVADGSGSGGGPVGSEAGFQPAALTLAPFTDAGNPLSNAGSGIGGSGSGSGSGGATTTGFGGGSATGDGGDGGGMDGGGATEVVGGVGGVG